MINKIVLTLLYTSSISISVLSQQANYYFKHFVSYDDPKKFVRIVPKQDGFVRTYLLISPEIYDIDVNNTTYIKSTQQVLVCIEGQYKNGQREGVFPAYIIDSIDHSKRYKIWEQTYSDNKLNGEWSTFTIKGNLVRFYTYKNDSLNGVARDYWIDGKSIIEERIYFNGKSKYIQKEYSQSGNVVEEITFVNDVPNGPAKIFYPNGILKDEFLLENGVPNGLRRYYYPTGKIWIEQQMKNGQPWTVIANYDTSGKKRDAGTLKEGNGTVILYNDNGAIREILKYINGVEVKK